MVTRRAWIGIVVVATFAGGMLIGALLGAGPAPTGSVPPSLIAVASPGRTPAPTPGSSATATANATGSPSGPPSPTPSPTPQLVAAPLTGLPVTPAAALQHPVAVMVDDQQDARPQSGFTSASVVWQAPAEGGIPRYMMIFQDTVPAAVGPVRSARQYFVEWASELNAVYVHVGGSPQAMATLASKGHGQLVYNADEFRYGGRYLWRIHQRVPPHNVYTDGAHLRSLARVVGAADGPLASPWTFGEALDYDLRPTGGRIEVAYLANRIRYDYDRATNTYLRSVSGGKPQIDAANGARVAPTNVVVMFMHFGPLNDGHPNKKRLEADQIGTGVAYIATNGTTIKARWRKTSITGPTTFIDTAGNPIALTPGQTFIQVMPLGYGITIVPGTPPRRPGGMVPV